MKAMRFSLQVISQQVIVFAIFVILFAAFALLLPGFFTAGNLLALVQNVAFLGILGLGMAIVVIGRGIDISMVAALAVPAGLVLQMVQNGHPLSEALLAPSPCAGVWLGQRLADRLCRSAVAFHDACLRPFSCRARSGGVLPARRRAMARQLDGLGLAGARSFLRHSNAGDHVWTG